MTHGFARWIGLPKSPQTGSDVKSMAYMGVDPPEMREMVADYYNCISRLDSLIGDLLSTLEGSGKAENTIVIYIGDHGADMLRGKRTSYEGGVRVPMIMRWPSQIKPHVEEALVSTVDIMPTVLEAAKASPVAGLPGRSLQPLMSGEPVTWRNYLFTEYHTHAAAPNYHPQRAVRNDRYKLIENLLPDTLNPDYANTIRKLEADATSRGEKGFTGGLHKAIANAPSEVVAAYALMEKPPRYELYDLQNDPYEFHNLAASPDHASTLVDLQSQLTHWREQTKDPLLDPKNLQRLTAEVTAVTNKSEGKSTQWGYVDYFFGKESNPTAVESSKKKRGRRSNETKRERSSIRQNAFQGERPIDCRRCDWLARPMLIAASLAPCVRKTSRYWPCTDARRWADRRSAGHRHGCTADVNLKSVGDGSISLRESHLHGGTELGDLSRWPSLGSVVFGNDAGDEDRDLSERLCGCQH